jgi:acetyl esterase/lipase
MALFRQISSASTQRFMASSFVKQTLASLPNDESRKEEERAIPVRDGEVQVRIYRPRSSFSTGRPVMIMSHGGGWCLGGLDTETFLCRLFCSSLDLVVVDVEYRLCPEFRYPVPVLDVFDAAKWVGMTCLPSTVLTNERCQPMLMRSAVT